MNEKYLKNEYLNRKNKWPNLRRPTATIDASLTI